MLSYCILYCILINKIFRILVCVRYWAALSIKLGYICNKHNISFCFCFFFLSFLCFYSSLIFLFICSFPTGHTLGLSFRHFLDKNLVWETKFKRSCNKDIDSKKYAKSHTIIANEMLTNAMYSIHSTDTNTVY